MDREPRTASRPWLAAREDGLRFWDFGRVLTLIAAANRDGSRSGELDATSTRSEGAKIPLAPTLPCPDNHNNAERVEG
jgi:hypothetical protein